MKRGGFAGRINGLRQIFGRGPEAGDILGDLRDEGRVLSELGVVHAVGGVAGPVVILVSRVTEEEIRNVFHGERSEVAAWADEIGSHDEHFRAGAFLHDRGKFL